MAGKDKAVESVTESVNVGREPWQHGDKPVIHIHPLYWEMIPVDQQKLMEETYHVEVTGKVPAPEVELEA